MSNAENEKVILEFVRKVVHPSVEVDTMIVEEGLLDSFDAVEVIDFLEERFELRIDPADIKKEDIASIRTLAAFVERALAKKAAAGTE